MGKCQKVPKFDFQSQFYMSKIISIFLNFFSLKNINLGAHFLLLTLFDNFKIERLLFLKWLLIFDTSPLTQFSKFNNFLWVCWFLGKNLSNFVPLLWKLLNPYCHRYWPGGSHPHLFWNLVNTNRISTNKRKYLAEKTRKGNKLHIPMCVSQFCISNFLSDLLQNCRFIHV